MADYSRLEARHLSVEVKDRVAVATMNRPERLNAIGDGLHDALEDFLREVSTDPDVNAVILTGAGRAFSSGGDVKGMSTQSGGARDPRDLLRGPKYLIQHFLNCEVPLVAAVNGAAAGLGATLALMCDVVFMADSARIGDTHVRAGVVAGDGGAMLWPHLVGVNRAKELLMSGKLLNAQEAEQLGLVNHVVPTDRLMDEAMSFARQLADGPPLAIRMTKMAVNKHLWQSFHSVQEFSLAVEELTFRTEDHREAASAFVEKREPKFRGI